MTNLIADITSALPNAAGGLWLLLDATIKGSVILIAALLVSNLLRGSAPRYRYSIWAFALCSLLALPLLGVVLPTWSVPLLPTFAAQSPSDATPKEPPPLNPLRISAPIPVVDDAHASASIEDQEQLLAAINVHTDLLELNHLLDSLATEDELAFGEAATATGDELTILNRSVDSNVGAGFKPARDAVDP